MSERKIIYVDDKDANLLAFKALLRRTFKVYTSNNPQEAINLIGAEKIAVVITDFKMPLMNGVEFLSLVRAKYPDTVRILLSGHADINAVIESVNKGEVFRFIKKPWIDELLINEINNAFELYDTRQNLHEKNDQLKSAYEELAYFTYSAAHNLTGPVATLKGLLDLIKNEPEKTAEYLDYTSQTLESMSGHLANVISFNKNKVEEIKPRIIDFEKLISTSIKEVELVPGRNAIDIQTHVVQKGEFVSDYSRISLIFSNIILNAIKFVDNRKTENLLKISVAANSESASVEIEDNGIGISEENLPRIFDIFFREATGQVGSGIGLYIVKQALERIKGEIEVGSEKGAFTRFHIKLPALRQ